MSGNIDLTIEKKALPANTVFLSSDPITFQFTITNNGNISATGFTLEDWSFVSSQFYELINTTIPEPNLALSTASDCTPIVIPIVNGQQLAYAWNIESIIIEPGESCVFEID